MTEALRCPGCGAGLPTDAPEGLCPGCLLNQAMRVGSGSGPDDWPGATTPYSPGPAFIPPRPEDLAPRFPQLEVLELLGQGGMGVVYKARQLRLDRLVALKILPPELGRDPAFAERFAREARALARLTHPRIVGVHDFGQSGGLFYLVMEFVDGVNLRGLLGGGRLGPEEALRIVPQVCEALQYAHEEGIVHRDIKPENILLDRRGNVKIADFGLAKLLGTVSSDSFLTGSRQVIGTLRYMAPEQMDTPLAVDHRADIYSLGVVFYEMLTGDLPAGRFDPPSKRAGVDVRLDEVVLRAMDREPDRRYQHASEVKTDVESLSLPPGHPGTRSSMSPDGFGGRINGIAGVRREAWLLLPLVFVACVAYGIVMFCVRTIERDTLAPAAFLSVIVTGLGLWGTWRFVRGGRAEHIKGPDGSRTHRIAMAAVWSKAWPLVPVICAGFIIDAVSWELMPAAILLAAVVELGTSWLFLRSRRVGQINLLDEAASRRPGDTGLWWQTWLLVPVLCAAHIVLDLTRGRPPHHHAIILAAGVGLWALWVFVRGARAGDVALLEEAGSRRSGATWLWRQTWLLVPLLCAAAIVHASDSLYFPDQYVTLVLGYGIGLWALWQFVREGRARDRLVTDGTSSPAVEAAEALRQGWLLIPILCVAYIVAVVVGDKRSPHTVVLATGIGLWAIWQFVRMGRASDLSGIGGTKGHVVEAAATLRQAWLLIPIFCVSYIVHAMRGHERTPHTIVLAAGVGLWALWQFDRGRRAASIRRTRPQLDPPKPDPIRDFDSF